MMIRTGEMFSRISRWAWILTALPRVHARLQILQAASGMRREVGGEKAGRVHARQSTRQVGQRHRPGGEGHTYARWSMFAVT
nr:hypothetical protein D3W47_08890 [Deinococcus sp. RM]